MNPRHLSIGELAEATGCRAETIRYYEHVGLLPRPSRTSANYRAYSQEDVARLRFVRRARDLGFSLEAIRDLLRMSNRREDDCKAVDRIASEHLAAVEHKISDLRSLAKELRHVIGQCRGGQIAECRIIEALASRARRKRLTKFGIRLSHVRHS